MKKEFFKPDDIIEALEKGSGYVSVAADYLGCAIQTVYNYRDRYPEVAEAWKQIHERRHDVVESSLHKQIKAGNTAATIFYLKTRARHRGYVERHEITGGDGGDLKVILTWSEGEANSEGSV